MDDVSRNIRAEMNRDAVPTPEEVRQKHRNYLRDKGCEVCGETDPDKLTVKQPYMGGCYGGSRPSMDGPPVFCHEHYRSPKTFWRARQIKLARDRDTEAVVFYDCGSRCIVDSTDPETTHVKEQVGRDGAGLPIFEEREIPKQVQPVPEAPIRHRCDAEIEEIVYL